MMVSLNDDILRFAAAADTAPDTEEIMLPVNVRRSEDILYLDILVGKEEETL